MNSQKKLEFNLSKKSDSNSFSPNSKIKHSTKTYITNIKKTSFIKNSRFTNKNPIIYLNSNNSHISNSNLNSYKKINNLTNKYKTTKNSPNKVFKGDNPKNLKYYNYNTKKLNNKIQIINDNKKKMKINSKLLVNNSTNNNKKQNINKIKLINKRLNENVLINEIIKKRISKNKNKKNFKSKNSNNNSVNSNNTTSFRNNQLNSSDAVVPMLKYNNTNSGNKLKKIKEKLIKTKEDNKEKIPNGDNLNFTKSIILKYIDSYREKEIPKRFNVKSEKYLREKKNVIHGQTSKDFYIIKKIKKYISSVKSHQPLRKQKSYFSKTKEYNTITSKKLINNKLQSEKNLISSNRKLNYKIKITKKNNLNNKNKINNNKNINGEYTIFIKSNFNPQNVYLTSNNTKQNSKKESKEKNNKNDNKELKVKIVQKNNSHPIRLSSENNKNNNIKGTIKSISTNNYSYQNSEIFNKSSNINNKKVEIDYNYVYNNYILNNKKGLHYNIKNQKKKIVSSKSSKDKLNSNIILHKKNYLNLLFKKIKKNNTNYCSHNCSKDERIQERNFGIKMKTPTQIINKNKKINVKKNNMHETKNIRSIKNSPNKKNYENNFSINKLNNNHKSERYIGNNSKIDINKNIPLLKRNEFSKSNKVNLIIQKKLEKINEEKNNDLLVNEVSKNFEDINDIKYKDNKKIEIKLEKQKEDKDEKKTPDKDISDIEEDISLLNYLNNNVDFSLSNDASILNESCESIHNTMKDNNKFLIYNKSKEIISNYIKQYYLKHKKYPKTKMKFYKYGRLLGKGAYGKVNLCLHTLTGRLVAIKSINKSKITKERHREKIKIETTIMKTLSFSNNIVKILENYETKKHICIVMEYICAGDLLSYIKKRSKLTESVSKFIFKQIVLALKYIHSHNIVHRDIKLDNILIDLDNNIKICDFGVSKIIKKGDIMLDQCGTPAYIAPEILKNRGYEGFGVDIWSAGVVLYSMLSGNVPFKGRDIKELQRLIIEGEFKPINNISKEANHLIKCLLNVDPKSRITTEDILVHPWILNIDLNFFRTQNLFTITEQILLANSNVDYSDINNKENMVENFDIKNLDTEEDNENLNIKTKSMILAPFNSSVGKDEDDLSLKEDNNFNNSELIIRNGIIKFSPKTKDLNRNYELNNNQEIDNGIVILSKDSDENIKAKSPYDGSYNSKIYSKHLSPKSEKEYYSNKKKIDNKFINDKENNFVNKKILEKMEKLGYDKKYVNNCLIKKEFNYATSTYRILDKYFS